MATIISTLSDFISYVNTLYNSSSTAPTAGEEDYTVWTALANVAINVWENEDGVLWNELYAKYQSASDGGLVKSTVAGTYSYSCPSLFRFPVNGYVWLGSGQEKTAYKVIKPEELQLHEDDSGNWCYFLNGSLEFNPNLTIIGGEKINYSYYKKATKVSSASDTFEMSDPMFAVYYVLAELKKEEGNAGELAVAQEKLRAMVTKNMMPPHFGSDQFINKTEDGFGV